MNLARSLMCQTWFGETQGIRLLRAFEARFAHVFGNSALAADIHSQIQDEIRHAHSFARMIAKVNGQSPKLADVDASWRKILHHLEHQHSFATTVVGIYGLIEPFNILCAQTLLLPELDESDRREVEAIAKDEEKHVSLFALFEELIERGVVPADRNECSEMIQIFVDSHKRGMRLPDGQELRLPNDASRSFLKHVLQLQARVKSWPTHA